jgi:serine/threonine-protein kinase
VAKVLDFGLVHDVQRLREEEISGVTGTPAFMSPESISAPNDVDIRSDIYSLGAMAYFLLTGKYTFEGSNASEIWEQQLTQLPTAPSVRRKTSIARELEELTMRCLSIDPGDRPESIAEVEKILSEIESPWTQSEAAAWWRDMESASENTETDAQLAETVDLRLNEPKS